MNATPRHDFIMRHWSTTQVAREPHKFVEYAGDDDKMEIFVRNLKLAFEEVWHMEEHHLPCMKMFLVLYLSFIPQVHIEIGVWTDFNTPGELQRDAKAAIEAFENKDPAFADLYDVYAQKFVDHVTTASIKMGGPPTRADELTSVNFRNIHILTAEEDMDMDAMRLEMEAMELENA